MVEAIWQNSVVIDGKVVHLDLEWTYRHWVAVNVLLIRAVYWFLVDLQEYSMLAACLYWRSTRSIIETVASQLGIQLGVQDVHDLLSLESASHSAALGRSQRRSRYRIKLILLLPQHTIKTLYWLTCRLADLLFYTVKLHRVVNRLYHDRIAS